MSDDVRLKDFAILVIVAGIAIKVNPFNDEKFEVHDEGGAFFGFAIGFE